MNKSFDDVKVVLLGEVIELKKDYFNIPNMMGYFRILMIPVFLYLYFHEQCLIAFIVLAVSLAADLFDGIIARKYNMVTDFGKALDLIADKLNQVALIIAVIYHFPLIYIFLMIFLIKELYMAIMGIYLLRNNIIKGAIWQGKICTVIIDIGIFILLLFSNMNYNIAYIFMFIMIITVVYTLIKYIQFHINLIRGKTFKNSIIFTIFALFLLFILIGIITPYIKQPEVSQSYQDEFNIEDYYGTHTSKDRATILEKNDVALEERIRLIENAKNRIILSTFDFRSDVSGKQIISSLIQASNRNVKVQILIDGFNFFTHMQGNPYFYSLVSQENVEIKIYNQINLITPWKGMSRMHDKYLIADEEVYILGGRNTFDYFLGNADEHKNYDRDVLVFNNDYEDSSLYQIIGYFDKIWNQKECKLWEPREWIYQTKHVKDANIKLDEIYHDIIVNHNDWRKKEDYKVKTVEVNHIQLISNPTALYSKEPTGFYNLTQIMSNAEEKVIIHTPYIICNEMMYNSFQKICHHVDVTLMTNSASNNGNPFGAVDFVLNKEKILNTGLNVLEYNGGVSYHGKSILIDDHMSIIGSFNMDMKSVYQDTELMLFIDSEPLNQLLSENMETYHEDCKDAQEVSYLYDKDMSLTIKIQRFILKFLAPIFRFLW